MTYLFYCSIYKRLMQIHRLTQTFVACPKALQGGRERGGGWMEKERKIQYLHSASAITLFSFHFCLLLILGICNI